MLIELALLAFFLYCVLLIMKIWRLKKFTENIPGEKSYPLIGNAHLLINLGNMTNLWFFSKRLMENHRNEGIFKFWFGPLLGIAISDPKYIEVISNSPYTVNKGSIYKRVMGEVFHGAVMAESDKKWKELRRPLIKSFTKKMFENDYHFVFVRRSNAFVQYIKDHKCGVEFDVFLFVSNLLLDMFSETHLGVYTNEVVEQKFNWVMNFDKYFSSNILIIFRCYFSFKKFGEYFSELGKKLRRSKEEMFRFFLWVFEERASSNRKCKEGVEYYSDFLLRRRIEKKLPYEVIQKELADMVLAASDTSSTITSGALVFLAMFPEIQEEAYQEQMSIFGNSDRDPTVDDLSSMVFLKMIIKETMRTAGVPGFFRTASQDIHLDEYTIPKGAYIYIWQQKVHSDPKYWEKPTEFYPNHFLPEKESARPTFAYIPFGVNPRMCAGLQYGMTTIMVMLSSLLRNFELKTTKTYEDLIFDFKLLLQMHDGYNVTFIERNKT